MVVLRASETPWPVSKFFNGEIGIGIDADVCGDPHRFDRNLPRVELTVTRQRAGRIERVGSPGWMHEASSGYPRRIGHGHAGFP